MTEYHPKMLSPVGLSFSIENLATVTFADTSPPATPTKVTSPRLTLQHTKSEVKLLNRIIAMDSDSDSVEIITERVPTTDDSTSNTHEEVASPVHNEESIDTSDSFLDASTSKTQKVTSPPQNDESMDSSDSLLDNLYDTTTEAKETPTPDPPAITPATTNTLFGVGIPFGTTLVDLYISPANHHFKIHKDLLCKIPYFSRMFNNGNFKESLDQKAYFPSDSVETFALFLEWLYTKRCDSISLCKGVKGDSDTAGKGKVEDIHIVKLYILSQMMFLPLLQDCAISLLLDHYQKASEYPSLEMMGYIYENTPEGSGARKFVAETIHSVIKRPFNDPDHRLSLKALSGFMIGNREVVLDVLGLSASVKERDWCHGGISNSYELRRCLFHCHEKGEEKGCLYK